MSVFIPIPKKDNDKEYSNYHTQLQLISHINNIMLKILQARLQQYMNGGLPDFQAGFRKGRGARDQSVNICWIIKKAREFQENIYFFFIDYAKAFVWITTNRKILQEVGIPDHLTCLLRNLYAVQEATVRTGHGTRTGSKLGKEYVKAVYCLPAYLTYMQSTSCKMLGRMKHKLHSRLLGEISITSDIADDTTLMAESKEL